MRRLGSHPHTFLLTILVLVCLAAFIPQDKPAAAQSGSDFFWSNPPTSTSVIVSPTTPTVVLVTGAKLSNKAPGTITDTFDISVALPASSWNVEISPSDKVAIKSGSADVSFTFKLTIPAGWPVGTQAFTIVAKRERDSTEASTFFTLNLTAATPTAPAPAPGTICPEDPDPGGDEDGATLILVNRPEKHGICTIGDEDWFKFGGIVNKVYSMAVTDMDNGLDLSLELYDDQGKLLDNNDDNTSDPNKPDMKPLIKSFRAPTNAMYFIRVRDTLGLGGKDLSYTVVVTGESYGTNPNTIPAAASACNDKYEPDGLPELASLITSNETQSMHLLCPIADADWVKFFGLSNYTYSLSTSTSAYTTLGTPEPGADTILYLFGRDGVTLIGSNNNVSGTLDSQILFTPTVDGFYYAQVKNVGDNGNQFIKYDLKLAVCTTSPPCGPPAAQKSDEPVVIASPPPPNPASNPNNNDSLFLPQSTVAGKVPSGFSDIAFAQVWQRADQPIAQRGLARSWMWGPAARIARTESYVQAASGLRQVQYFDKGRMEINNPSGDRSSNWFVTSGLLVEELVTGRMQTGDGEFERRTAARIAVAGDLNDPNAPTYASLARVTDRYIGDQTGQLPADSLDRAGAVSPYGGPRRDETRWAHYVTQTGHNIPQVFWNFMNERGPIFENGRYHTGLLMDWVFTLGYPISDAYWTQVRVDGVVHDVLIQPFERRVLTYMPDAPNGWQVQLGNVGRHYYLWRYDEDLSS